MDGEQTEDAGRVEEAAGLENEVAPAVGRGPVYRPPTGLRTWTVALLMVTVVFDLALVLVDLLTAKVLARVDRSAAIPAGTMGDLGAIQTVRLLLMISWTLGFLPTVLVFCLWFRRVMVNVKALSPMEGPSPLGAVLGFFIPIGNFFRPYFAAAYAWRATAELEAAPPAKPRGGGMVAVWWASWLLALGVWMAMADNGTRIGASNQSIPWEALSKTNALDLANDAAWAVSAVVCAVLVIKLTGMQVRVVKAAAGV